MSTTKKVLLMILIGIIYFVFDTMLQAGVFKSVTNNFYGEELAVYHGVFGPEDMEWDRDNNQIFISSLDRRSQRAGKPQDTDGIYLIHPNVENDKPILLKTSLKGGFHPHGISLFKLDGKTYLYAINHNKGNNTVELFQFKDNFLDHLETYKGEEMFSPNDVVGDEIGKFYVTNDHGNRTDFWKKIEDYLRMPYSYVLYYDGAEFSKAHQGMVYANGVQFSNDGSKLYASHTTGHEVFVLDRNIKTGMLIVKETIKINSGLDNIDVDENDHIWVTGHPKVFDFLAHFTNSSYLSASEIYEITLVGKEYKVSKVYENDGSQISAASVVVAKNDTLFVGCVFDDNIVKLHSEKP